MPATLLNPARHAKPWGRRSLCTGFDDVPADEQPVGEIWFEGPGKPELLIKYLFTSERLSIQVHPGDAAAQAAGYPRGKDEAWVVLAAEPGSTIALGPKEALTRDTLRAAALDGSIEVLLDWRPAAAGDVIYSPAGTVHTIGAGITLIEVQQNVDLTYRLYDYGRPRDLHLDAGIAVARLEPVIDAGHSVYLGPHRTILVSGGKFVLERWAGEAVLEPELDRRPGWFIPVAGSGRIDGAAWAAGECWAVEGDAVIGLGAGAEALFAYPGPNRIGRIMR